MTATPNIDTMFSSDVLAQKLLDADSCGFQAECTPEEAEAMGVFSEDALELDEAINGALEAAEQKKAVPGRSFQEYSGGMDRFEYCASQYQRGRPSMVVLVSRNVK